MVTGAGSITLLGFFSSLWQLVLKELPWLILVYYSVHQALKGHLFLASFSWASLVAQLVKNPPAMQETWVRSLGWEDPLEKGKTTYSSILA